MVLKEARNAPGAGHAVRGVCRMTASSTLKMAVLAPIHAGVIGNCDYIRLLGMPVLTVAALRSHPDPSVRFQQPDNFAGFHVPTTKSGQANGYHTLPYRRVIFFF